MFQKMVFKVVTQLAGKLEPKSRTVRAHALRTGATDCALLKLAGEQEGIPLRQGVTG